MANFLLFAFGTSGEFVARNWMLIYSGEAVLEETDHNLVL